LDSRSKPKRKIAVVKKQPPAQQVVAKTTPQAQEKPQVKKTALPESKTQQVAKAPAPQSSPTPSPQTETAKRINSCRKL
jgi:hypothetical protein